MAFYGGDRRRQIDNVSSSSTSSSTSDQRPSNNRYFPSRDNRSKSNSDFRPGQRNELQYRTSTPNPPNNRNHQNYRSHGNSGHQQNTRSDPVAPRFARSAAARSEHRDSASRSGENRDRFGPTLIDRFIKRDDDYWQNRVTIKMDVAFTDHSHIIGRTGKNTQSIMRATGCHIHFPDSNRDEYLPKSNQVSIAGPLAQVEKARHALRELSPLSVTFNLGEYKGDINRVSTHPTIRRVTESTNVTLLINENRTTALPFAVIKGNLSQADDIASCIIQMQQFLLKKAVPVTLTTEICVPQQEDVTGPRGCNMHDILRATGAEIIFPQVGESGNATTFYIQGMVECVMMARKYLMGILPFSMTFDIPVVTPPVGPKQLEQLEACFGLSLLVRPKRVGEGDSVVVRGTERQLNQIYQMRGYFVPTQQEELPERSSDYDFMQHFRMRRDLFDVRYQLQPLHVQAPIYVGSPSAMALQSSPIIAINPYCAIVPATMTPSPLTTGTASSSSSSKEDLQQQPGPSADGAAQALSGRPPLQPHFVQPVQAMQIQQQMPATTAVTAVPVQPPVQAAAVATVAPQAQVQPQKKATRRAAPPPPLPLNPEITSNVRHASVSSGYNSSVDTPLSSSSIRPVRPTNLLPHSSLATVNGMPLEPINSPGPITPVVAMFPAPEQLIKPSPDDLNGACNPLGSSMLMAAVGFQQEELEQDKWKIVGNGRDYQEMAKKASKAIKEFPNGPRTPNSQFAGFFFSKSMPSSELNKLKEMNKAAAEAEAKAKREGPIEEESGEDVPETKQKVTAVSKPVRKFDPDSTGYFDSLLGGSQKSPRGQPFDPASEDIEQLLQLLNLGQCVEVFSEEEISVSELLSLTEDDMKDLDLKFQHRRKLKCAIQKITQARNAGSCQMVYL